MPRTTKISVEKETNRDRLLTSALLNDLFFLRLPWAFVEILGLNAGALFAQLIYLDQKFRTDDGWFWRTEELLEKRTTLSPFLQRESLKKIEENKLINRKRMKRDRRNYFKIDYEAVANLVVNYMARLEKNGGKKFEGPVVNRFDTKKTYSKKSTKEIYKENENIFYYHLFPMECTHLSNEVFTDAWEKFCEYRAKKNWTERAAKGIIFTQKDRPKTLIRYEPIIAAKMLLRSVNKKWTGVFELSEEKQSDKGIIQDAYPDISSIFRFNCRKGTPKLEEELRTLAYKFGTWYAGVESQSPGIWKKLNYGTFKTSSLLATRYEMWLGEPEQDWFKAPWYPKALWPTGEIFKKFIDDLNTRFGNLDLTAFIKRED